MTNIRINIHSGEPLDDPECNYPSPFSEGPPIETVEKTAQPKAKRHFHFDIPAGARVHSWGQYFGGRD